LLLGGSSATAFVQNVDGQKLSGCGVGRVFGGVPPLLLSIGMPVGVREGLTQTTWSGLYKSIKKRIFRLQTNLQSWPTSKTVAMSRKFGFREFYLKLVMLVFKH